MSINRATLLVVQFNIDLLLLSSNKNDLAPTQHKICSIYTINLYKTIMLPSRLCSCETCKIIDILIYKYTVDTL